MVDRFGAGYRLRPITSATARWAEERHSEWMIPSVQNHLGAEELAIPFAPLVLHVSIARLRLI